MKFNFLPKIDFKKKSSVAFVVFWALIIILALIIINYGSKNHFGFDIFTQEYRDRVGDSALGSYEYTHDTEDISTIDIRWQSGKIELRPTDGDEFRITETSAKELEHSDRLTIDGEDGSLLIKWDEETGLAETLRGQYDKDLVLEIPAEMELESIKISSVYGEISLSELEAYEVNLSSISAEVTVNDCKAEDLTVSTDAGEIKLSGTMANDMKLTTTSGNITAEDSVGYDLKLDSVSGDISFAGSFEKLTGASTAGSMKLSANVLPVQIKLGSVSGKVSLSIPEDSWLPVTMESVSGEMKTDFEELAAENFPDADVDETDEEAVEKYISIGTTSGNAELIKGEKSITPVEIFPEEESTEEDE